MFLDRYTVNNTSYLYANTYNYMFIFVTYSFITSTVHTIVQRIKCDNDTTNSYVARFSATIMYEYQCNALSHRSRMYALRTTNRTCKINRRCGSLTRSVDLSIYLSVSFTHTYKYAHTHTHGLSFILSLVVALFCCSWFIVLRDFNLRASKHQRIVRFVWRFSVWVVASTAQHSHIGYVVSIFRLCISRRFRFSFWIRSYFFLFIKRGLIFSRCFIHIFEVILIDMVNCAIIQLNCICIVL